MDLLARYYYLDETIEKVRRTQAEVYLNLYPAELNKLKLRYPDLEVQEIEPIESQNRKVKCRIRLKSE